MDFFKLKKFRKAKKPSSNNAAQQESDLQVEEPQDGSVESNPANVDPAKADMEDDDDDFITDEVKRRLKELRRNNFMVLIPEEASVADEEEEEEEGETISAEWRDVVAEGHQFWSGFNAVYDIYCKQMLVFDQLGAQHLLELGSHPPPTPSPRSASKRLASPLACLSLKTLESRDEEIEHLQQPNDPLQDLETVYVAHLCLSWEALHCQYTQLKQKIYSQPERSLTSYNHSAQQFQQFQVLLQRFIENEPFEQGLRPEIYARTRNTLPILLQVPKIQGCDEKSTGNEDEPDVMILGTDLIKVVESCILSFRQFIKSEKKKSGGVLSLFGSQHHMATPVQQIQSSLDKKAMKVKELWKKSKSYKKKSWPTTAEEVEMLLGLVDVKVVSRALRMSRISKQQLLWCEEKIKKLGLSDGKLHREPSPILFPC